LTAGASSGIPSARGEGGLVGRSVSSPPSPSLLLRKEAEWEEAEWEEADKDEIGTKMGKITRLTDATGEAVNSREIAFDAVRFTPR
jgi:hypothetical protein